MSVQRPPSITSKTLRALARSRWYALLARGFIYPEAELVSAICEGSYSRELEEALVGIESSRQLRRAMKDLQAWVSGLSETDPARWGETYLEFFGSRRSERPLPYEAEWGQTHEFMKTQCLADLGGFYRAFGLEPAERIRERLDYLGTELEFMAYLAFKEGYARDQGWASQQRVCRKAQRSFLAQHVGRWVIPFCMALTRVSEGTFYAPLARITQAFLRRELREFRVTREETGLRLDLASKQAVLGIGVEGDCQWCSVSPKELDSAALLGPVTPKGVEGCR